MDQSNSDAPNMSCETTSPSFNLFNELPPELRIRIWQHAMPDARIVAVKSPYNKPPQRQAPSSLTDALAASYEHDFNQINRSEQQRAADEEAETWHSNAPIPSLLHVNAESRHEALKHYQLALGSKNRDPRIYVDFSKDTLFFGDAELESRCTPLWSSTPDLKHARKLAIVPESAWRVLRWWPDVDLNSLQKLTFIHGAEAVDVSQPLPPLEEDSAYDVDDEENEQDTLDELVESQSLSRNPSFTKVANIVPKQSKQQRQLDARQELDTLMQVLPALWNKEPVVSTAVFSVAGATICAR